MDVDKRNQILEQRKQPPLQAGHHRIKVTIIEKEICNGSGASAYYARTPFEEASFDVKLDLSGLRRPKVNLLNNVARETVSNKMSSSRADVIASIMDRLGNSELISRYPNLRDEDNGHVVGTSNSFTIDCSKSLIEELLRDPRVKGVFDTTELKTYPEPKTNAYYDPTLGKFCFPERARAI